MATQRSGLGSCQTAGGGGGASYIPGLLTQDCRAHLRSPKFQPAEGGTQNRSLACAGSESLGRWGDTLGRHLLPLMVLQVFRVQVQPGSRADVDKRTDPTLTPLTAGTFLILH